MSIRNCALPTFPQQVVSLMMTQMVASIRKASSVYLPSFCTCTDEDEAQARIYERGPLCGPYRPFLFFFFSSLLPPPFASTVMAVIAGLVDGKK